MYSYREDIHDTITNVRGSWRRTINAIKRLVNEGIRVRGSVVYIHINQYDILNTIEFLKEIGVTIIAFSPAFPYGRGSNLKSVLLNLDYENISIQINEAIKRFSDKLQIVPDDIRRFVESHGCGSGWRSAVDPLVTLNYVYTEDQYLVMYLRNLLIKSLSTLRR